MLSILCPSGRFDLSILCQDGHQAEKANKYQETHKTPAALYLLSDNPLIPDASLLLPMCARAHRCCPRQTLLDSEIEHWLVRGRLVDVIDYQIVHRTPL